MNAPLIAPALPADERTQSESRVGEILAADYQRLCADTDRWFALLLLVQWLLAIVIARYATPLTWSADVAAVNPHLWAALVLGGIVTGVPALLALAMPGQSITRHVVAVGQMGVGILLIHLTGGRIETHFHVFGSLAFLATYRDRSVLLTATIIVVIDHSLRAVYWPYSAFGVATATLWRPLEHAAWVVFEDIVLLAICSRANESARLLAERQAKLEELNDTIEARVERRTKELVDSRYALERTNIELIEATERALESSRAKSAFLATVSHEVRTPLNGIIGVAELLRDTPLESDQSEYVDIIDRSGHALLGIINDILDYSKLEAGKLEAERVELDLLEQLDHVMAVIAPAAAAKQLAFCAIVAPDVPRRILGDAGRINQVLINLTGNAVKFTERGHVLVRLSKTGDEQPPRLRFDVEDTGLGIAPETLTRLFQPFTQADASTTRRFGGTGLGLAISRSLAELLGGSLSATSTPGAGSTFRFELELCVAPGAAPAITALPPLPPGRAVVVASEPQGAGLIAEQLRGWGIDADVADPHNVGALADAALVIGYELDAESTLQLRLVAGQARLASLRAPVTPMRLWRELSGEAPELPAPAPPVVTALPPRFETERDSPCALVVEDNPVNQRIAIKMVQRLGYRVHTAENGLEAMRKVRTRRYDIILMDCQMPEMDGYEATRAIRDMEAALAHTPIVAVTANAMASDRERCLAAGMDDFLSKPLTMAALQQVFGRYLEQASLNPTPAPHPSGTR
jgi:two-component system sensor histidine kinase/response regulator